MSPGVGQEAPPMELKMGPGVIAPNWAWLDMQGEVIMDLAG